MNKIRGFLATIALLATLSGPFVLGMGSTSLANAVASRPASSAFVVGKVAKSDAPKPYWPCPTGGAWDC